jgi:hypothetical protein
MAKSAKTYRLTNTAIEYLNEFADKNNLNLTEALERILREHKCNSDKEIDILSNALLAKFDDKYKNMFTRIRLGSNTADVNSQIILEILNTMLITQSVNTAFTSKIVKSPVWEDCDIEVKRRIAEYKQIKDNKQIKE